MNDTINTRYAEVTSSFYGIGGVLRLSRFMDAFEKANKEEFEKAVTEALKRDGKAR